MTPEPPLLARRHLELQERGSVFGRSIGGRLAVWIRIACLAQRGGSRIGVGGALVLQTARDRFTKDRFGLPYQFRFHIGEDAVEVEGDAEGHVLLYNL